MEMRAALEFLQLAARLVSPSVFDALVEAIRAERSTIRVRILAIDPRELPRSLPVLEATNPE